MSLGKVTNMINEHDIADMCQLDKLHEGDKFSVLGDYDTEVFKLKHFSDGFAFCYDSHGVLHHFATWIKVVKV
jgi:hypothetical protein